jgi:hypothetical protein
MISSLLLFEDFNRHILIRSQNRAYNLLENIILREEEKIFGLVYLFSNLIRITLQELKILITFANKLASTSSLDILI